MKKLLALLIIFSATAGVAQDRNKEEKIKVDFHGIDFTAVNVVGANESPEQFIDAFKRINGLLISEQKKYDVGKYFNLDVVSTDIDYAVNRLQKLSGYDFKDRNAYDIDPGKIVADYPDSEHNGMVIIAKELNKLTDRGTFIAVIYDGKTKQILFEKEFSGKTGGFGLRNYWAGALHEGMKKVKF